MSYFFQLHVMLHAYVQRFDVMDTVEKKIQELNMAQMEVEWAKVQQRLKKFGKDISANMY